LDLSGALELPLSVEFLQPAGASDDGDWQGTLFESDRAV
jgi:hypothetical protein